MWPSCTFAFVIFFSATAPIVTFSPYCFATTAIMSLLLCCFATIAIKSPPLFYSSSNTIEAPPPLHPAIIILIMAQVYYPTITNGLPTILVVIGGHWSPDHPLKLPYKWFPPLAIATPTSGCGGFNIRPCSSAWQYFLWSSLMGATTMIITLARGRNNVGCDCYSLAWWQRVSTLLLGCDMVVAYPSSRCNSGQSYASVTS